MRLQPFIEVQAVARIDGEFATQTIDGKPWGDHYAYGNRFTRIKRVGSFLIIEGDVKARHRTNAMKPRLVAIEPSPMVILFIARGFKPQQHAFGERDALQRATKISIAGQRIAGIGEAGSIRTRHVVLSIRHSIRHISGGQGGRVGDITFA